MRRSASAVVALAALAAGAASAAAAEFPEGDARRGAYLARLAGCIGCHTDAAAGGAALAGGAAIETRFGTFRPPNISQHAEDGIGGWSIADFAQAVRQGLAPDGSPYYPAFPYPSYAAFSDQDIADLHAAFRTVPAAAGGRQGNDLSFPWSVRQGLHLWRALHFDAAPPPQDPARSEAWNRGAWIVEGPGHCGACHTPRGLLGGQDADDALTGSSDGPGGSKVPAITAAALAEKGWTADSLATALQTGLGRSGDAFGGGMGEVVRHSTAWLTPADRAAIAAYLLAP